MCNTESKHRVGSTIYKLRFNYSLTVSLIYFFTILIETNLSLLIWGGKDEQNNPPSVFDSLWFCSFVKHKIFIKNELEVVASNTAHTVFLQANNKLTYQYLLNNSSIHHLKYHNFYGIHIYNLTNGSVFYYSSINLSTY